MAARKRQLSELLGDLALAADVPAFTTSTLPTKAQATRLLNEALQDVTHAYKAFGLLFKTATIAVVSGTTQYALAADFAAMMYMRFTEGGIRRKIYRASIDDLDMEDTSPVGWTQNRAKYALLGDGVAAGDTAIYFNDPGASYTVTYGYVPEYPAFNSSDVRIADMSADTDYILSHGGIDKWIVLSAAMDIKQQQEQDVSALRARREEIEIRLQSHLTDRDAVEATAVRNTWGRRFDDEADRWG